MNCISQISKYYPQFQKNFFYEEEKKRLVFLFSVEIEFFFRQNLRDAQEFFCSL